MSKQTDTLADNALVQQAKLEREALGRLYDRRHSLIFRYCMRRLFVRATAEDVTADVFMQVASNITRFPGRTNVDFRCWVYRIASNAVNAHIRNKHRHEELIAFAVQGGQPTQEARGYFLAPNRYRQEFANQAVGIMDFDHGKFIMLMPQQKQAIVFDLKQNKTSAKADNYFGDLRALLAKHRDAKDQKVTSLEVKELNGKRAFGFQLVNPDQVVTLWGDVQTGRLTRIEVNLSGVVKTEAVFSDFDLPLEETLFSTVPPAGFTVITTEIDTTPPSEQDFIKALDLVQQMSGGIYPNGLDAVSLGVAFAKFAEGVEKLGADPTQQLMIKALSIGRGLSFATRLPVKSNPHYVGKGVKRTDAKTPVFWYLPEGATNYRVI